MNKLINKIRFQFENKATAPIIRSRLALKNTNNQNFI